jgi:hypothetical protein
MTVLFNPGSELMISLFGPYRTMSPTHQSTVSCMFVLPAILDRDGHTIFLVAGPDIRMEVSAIRVVNSIPRRQLR